jgi:hypothetical protein
MSTFDFFDYLASSDATRELALDLAEVWTEHRRSTESAA